MANYIPSEHLGEMYSDDRNEMTSKRRKLIHRDIASKKALGQTLPFEIGIFRPKLGHQFRDIHICCPACSRNIFVNKNTCMVICECGELLDTK
jgi:hypothetical protein